MNNLAIGRMVAQGRSSILLPAMHAIVDALVAMAGELAGAPMLCRTHGQPATPSPMGKEVANFAVRLARAARAVEDVEIMVRCTQRTTLYRQ